MGHTKGKWTTENIEKRTLCTQVRTLDDSQKKGGLVVCEVYGANAENTEANARLIAAAPALLEACEIAILALTHTPINPDDIKAIEQAIAKAEEG